MNLHALDILSKCINKTSSPINHVESIEYTIQLNVPSTPKMAVTRSRSNSTRRRTPSPKAKVTKETATKKKSKSSGKGLTKDAICSKLLPELKGLCDSYSVSSHGTRPEIVRRLLKHTNNSNLGDAIVVAEVNLPGDACSVSRVKQALIEATNNAAFFVQEIHGRKFIVDEESLSYATAKMDVPDDKNKLQEAEETIKQLEKQPMQISSEKEAKWNDVRHRVISTFKRHRNVATDNDMSIIERVSGLIHDGDAVTDASLFQPYGPRTDVDAYQRIYGLRPEEVRKIGKSSQLFLGMF